MREEKSKTGIVILALILVIVVLLGVIAYTFYVKPSIDGYVVKKQIEAKDVVLNSILLQLQQQGFVKITDQEGNSIVLAPVQQNTEAAK